jgi:hypothetical protein
VERIADACMSDIDHRRRRGEDRTVPGAEERLAIAVLPDGPLLACGRPCRGSRPCGACRSTAPMTRTWARWSRSRGPDGKVESIQVAVGRWLEIGDRVVTIPADDFDQLADRIRL